MPKVIWEEPRRKISVSYKLQWDAPNNSDPRVHVSPISKSIPAWIHP